MIEVPLEETLGRNIVGNSCHSVATELTQQLQAIEYAVEILLQSSL